jgi:hypothetical protein
MTPPLTSANQKFILVLSLFSNAMQQRLFLQALKYLLIITAFFLYISAAAQSATDSLVKIDSVRVDTATVILPVKDTIRPVLIHSFTSDSFLYRNRLFFSFTNPVRYTISEKTWQGKEAIFYSIIVLLIGFALVKNSFSRYLFDLFSSYFRTTVRQRQIKDQLLQSPLPSLLFNVLFVVSTAIFLSLVFQKFQLGGQYPFWMLVAYCGIGIILIYGGKFLVLKFFGWVFQMSDATDTYIFVVFSTNKILGVLLLPFTVLLAFTSGNLNAAAITLSLIVIIALLAYRYFLSFLAINRLLTINIFHFLIYLAAFEALPLLLINKLLLSFLREIT